MNMVLVATPTNYLQSDMHGAVAEALLWVKGTHNFLPHTHTHTLMAVPLPLVDVCSSDGCDDVRALADHTLSLLMTTTT